MFQFKKIPGLSILLLSGFMASAQALEVNISKRMSHVNTVHNGKLVKIKRNQDQTNVLSGAYTKTSRKCPPFCIQPMSVAPGVGTVGEVEVLNFIKDKVNHGTGVLIDARTASWFKKATIPGSINIPFNTFSKDGSDLLKVSALTKLGVTTRKEVEKEESLIDQMLGMLQDKTVEVGSQWDFSKAKYVVLWCNGMWCEQSPRAIRGLLDLGYPAEKIFYYRGGMQAWQSLGLTIVN